MLHDAKNTASESTFCNIVLDADDVIERPEIITIYVAKTSSGKDLNLAPGSYVTTACPSGC
jgi:hypothetical protein